MSGAERTDNVGLARLAGCQGFSAPGLPTHTLSPRARTRPVVLRD